MNCEVEIQTGLGENNVRVHPTESIRASLIRFPVDDKLDHSACLMYACGWPPAQWRHLAPGLETGRSWRSQLFALTRPAGTCRLNSHSQF